ncbi:MAG TPA: RNA 3'-terminal phosphate cyclase [Phycisphaerales bacterium]|nr:RNA 3'-terminal phosphate cyclase [Phycisphaerales bacterium]
MLEIDGSQGEGGGQVLRSSLALSMAMGVPFRLFNVRAGREKPGLMRQHLTALLAAAEISRAKVSGAAVGSTVVVFEPGTVRPGEYHFPIGTAGSTMLVLQAILPALLAADGPSRVVVEGGTHARWAPPFEFFAHALAPLLDRLGHRVSASILRYGFYPAGGGLIEIVVTPATSVKALQLHERGELRTAYGRAVVSKLPWKIGQRELHEVERRLGWPFDPDSVIEVKSAISPGNALSLVVESEHVTEVFCALGEQGRSSELVANEAIEQVRTYYSHTAPVGIYMADQLMVPLAIAALRGAGGSSFTTLPPSRHALTNSEIVGQFLGRRPVFEKLDRAWRWSVE